MAAPWYGYAASRADNEDVRHSANDLIGIRQILQSLGIGRGFTTEAQGTEIQELQKFRSYGSQKAGEMTQL